MDKRFIKLCVAIFSIPFLMIGQNEGKLKRANERFDQKAYANAIGSYEELIDEGYSSEAAFSRLGDAYYYNADYASASEWYGKLVNLDSTAVSAEYIYRYAQSLKSLGDYELSNQWMQRFETVASDDIRAQKYASNKEYLKVIAKNSGRYEIENMEFNSKSSDFAPAFYGEYLVFASARDTGKVIERIHSWNNRPFLNLFSVQKSEEGFTLPNRLPSSLNKKTHESSAVFTKDGNRVYFTRNNSRNGRFERDKKGLSRLKLFTAELIEGDWTNVKELPFNDDNYSVAHPSLASDGSKLYFASDMPGTFGNSDIFVVDINNDGTYGTPKNLGPEINTESRETFPFISQDGIMYFASDGHPGLGGLDVFATKISDKNKSYVVNLGEPINSALDDFAYISKEGSGYFTSNRFGGKGDDDIYGFLETEPLKLQCESIIQGIVLEGESKQALSGAKLKLMDDKGNFISEATTTSTGFFEFNTDCTIGDYRILAEKSGYEKNEVSFNTNTDNDSTELQLVLNRTIKKAEVGTELLSFLELEPVYFDLDKSNIRPDAALSLNKLVEYLLKFPDLAVEIQSHTDAKASKSYNERLSNERAKTTMDFLISKGIQKERLRSSGFGESRLKNNCKVWSNCEDNENEMNRRSEFVVIR